MDGPWVSKKPIEEKWPIEEEVPLWNRGSSIPRRNDSHPIPFGHEAIYCPCCHEGPFLVPHGVIFDPMAPYDYGHPCLACPACAGQLDDVFVPGRRPGETLDDYPHGDPYAPVVPIVQRDWTMWRRSGRSGRQWSGDLVDALETITSHTISGLRMRWLPSGEHLVSTHANAICTCSCGGPCPLCTCTCDGCTSWGCRRGLGV